MLQTLATTTNAAHVSPVMPQCIQPVVCKHQSDSRPSRPRFASRTYVPVQVHLMGRYSDFYIHHKLPATASLWQTYQSSSTTRRPIHKSSRRTGLSLLDTHTCMAAVVRTAITTCTAVPPCQDAPGAACCHHHPFVCDGRL
jgi:hypothetical protein